MYSDEDDEWVEMDGQRKIEIVELCQPTCITNMKKLKIYSKKKSEIQVQLIWKILLFPLVRS